MTPQQIEAKRARARARSAKYRISHREKVLASLKAYRASHLDQERARNKAYKDAHRKTPRRKTPRRKSVTVEEKRARCRAYHAAHKSQIAERKRSQRVSHGDRLRAQASAWARSNAALRALSSAKRRAVTLQAMPSWADSDAIEAIYNEASRLTLATGIQHDVDHFYPLQSPDVCGLHIAANLQILTHHENVMKRNKLPVVSVVKR